MALSFRNYCCLRSNKLHYIIKGYVAPHREIKRHFTGFGKKYGSENQQVRIQSRGFRQKRKDVGAPSKQNLLPEELKGPPKQINTRPSLWKPLGFTLMVSGTSFVGASIWQYESLRGVVQSALRGNNATSFYGKAGSLRHQINSKWNSLSGGQKVTAGIIGINVLVFAMWRVPALTRSMLTYFACSPASAAPCWSMLLSTFSHYSLWHIAANMYVLSSFSTSIGDLLGKEQYLAMYLSAGVVSAFASQVNKVLRFSLAPSLGASGAIMAVLGAVCSTHPNAQLSLAFIDQIFPHSFSAGSGMKFLVIMDAAGVLLGWRFFDHAAHLGGMLFGIWYVNYGTKLIWGNREPLMKWWHKLRGKPKP